MNVEEHGYIIRLTEKELWTLKIMAKDAESYRYEQAEKLKKEYKSTMFAEEAKEHEATAQIYTQIYNIIDSYI